MCISLLSDNTDTAVPINIKPISGLGHCSAVTVDGSEKVISPPLIIHQSIAFRKETMQ